MMHDMMGAMGWGMGLAGLIGILVSGLILRRNWREFGLSCLGIIFLITFVVLRAASFHHVDIVLYHLPRIGNWMNAGLEMGGSLLVSGGAWLALRRRQRNIDYLR